MPRLSILLVLLLCACTRTRTVTVFASVPGQGPAGTPAAGFTFAALPYDRDSLIAAFEARATTPKPSTAPLDSLFEKYRAPFAHYTALVAESNRFADSMSALKARLDTASRTSPEYTGAYRQWTAWRDSMRAVDAQAAAARAALEKARPAFIAQSESLRAAIRAWQDSTLKGYNVAAESLVTRSHREPAADTTDAAGFGAVTLRGGPWWIYARSWDPADPNAEWYWNVPVTADTIRLDASTARHRPRY